MRRLAPSLAVAALLTVAVLSCSRPTYVRSPRITGTCEGVCRHYLSCKDNLSSETMGVCVAECNQVFTGQTARRAYQGLKCDDAISFVEGDSGRGPGASVKPDQGAASRTP